jgi:hypothetical protein
MKSISGILVLMAYYVVINTHRLGKFTSRTSFNEVKLHLLTRLHKMRRISTSEFGSEILTNFNSVCDKVIGPVNSFKACSRTFLLGLSFALLFSFGAAYPYLHNEFSSLTKISRIGNLEVMLIWAALLSAFCFSVDFIIVRTIAKRIQLTPTSLAFALGTIFCAAGAYATAAINTGLLDATVMNVVAIKNGGSGYWSLSFMANRIELAFLAPLTGNASVTLLRTAQKLALGTFSVTAVIGSLLLVLLGMTALIYRKWGHLVIGSYATITFWRLRITTFIHTRAPKALLWIGYLAAIILVIFSGALWAQA